ncbi:MAG: DsrE family protein [Thermoproteus sp.]
MHGVILEADEPERLYAFATYVATLVARGEPVAVFVTGRAVKAFSRQGYAGPDLPESMDWRRILADAKELGEVKIYICETVAKAYGVSEFWLADGVGSMFSFLENVNSVVVF